MAADLTNRDLKDPNLGFVTFTRTHLSSDASLAEIYVSVFGEQKEKDESLQILNKAAGFYRSRIGKAIALRNSPRIVFVLDDLLDRAEHIDRLIDGEEE